MKRAFCFVVALVVMGCDQTQSVAACTNEGVDLGADGGAEKPIGQGGAGGEGGQGGNGVAPLVGDGGPCNENAECENAACLPSANDWSFGYCYSATMVGCIVVTDPSPMMAQCAGPSKRLYVCGDYDVSLLGTCTDVGTGQFGEAYHCCNKL